MDLLDEIHCKPRKICILLKEDSGFQLWLVQIAFVPLNLMIFPKLIADYIDCQ